MAVEQKKAAFDEAKDKLEARIDNKAETEGELSEDELEGVAGGVNVQNLGGAFGGSLNGKMITCAI